MRIIACSNGHQMSFLTHEELRAVSTAYLNGYLCDVCHEQITLSHRNGQDRLYHCGLCNYDVCYRCSIGAPRERPMGEDHFYGDVR